MHKRGLLHAAADFLLPPVCAVCEADTDGEPVCNECLDSIQVIERSFCQLCGQPLERSRRKYICAECVRKPLALERIRAWARFTHPLDKLVYAFKYSRRSSLAGFFARRLALVIQSDPLLRSARMIVPVPLHPLKSWWRSYNQSALLARSLARITGIEAQEVLCRTRMTRTQTKLDSAARRKNVQGAFSIRKRSPRMEGQKVILLDDVVTTGSTLDAAAEVLLAAGAGAVYGLTIGGAWIKR